MTGEKKVDSVEKEKRVYQISLMLRRKPVSFIVQYITENWKLEKRQAYKYIALARKEWQKYFTNIKKAGISYHISQLMELKDQAYSRKVYLGKGDNKEAVIIADLGLVFEITKEEAKIMGIYAPEKLDIKQEVIINITGEDEDSNQP